MASRVPRCTPYHFRRLNQESLVHRIDWDLGCPRANIWSTRWVCQSSLALPRLELPGNLATIPYLELPSIEVSLHSGAPTKSRPLGFGLARGCFTVQMNYRSSSHQLLGWPNLEFADSNLRPSHGSHLAPSPHSIHLPLHPLQNLLIHLDLG